MKKLLIVALVCINVSLVLVLVLGWGDGQAKAQAFRGSADYLVVTGKIATDREAIYAIDLGKRKLLAWEFSTTTKKLMPYRGRRLLDDFGRGKE